MGVHHSICCIEWTFSMHVSTASSLADYIPSFRSIMRRKRNKEELVTEFDERSTPLLYAACGGNAQCCQLLSIARGASLTAENTTNWLFVHQEKFNQPIFFCNNISGCVEPVVPEDQHRALYSTHSLKIILRKGAVEHLSHSSST